MLISMNVNGVLHAGILNLHITFRSYLFFLGDTAFTKKSKVREKAGKVFLVV